MFHDHQLSRDSYSRKMNTLVGLKSNPYIELISWLMDRTCTPFTLKLPTIHSNSPLFCFKSGNIEINEPLLILEYLDNFDEKSNRLLGGYDAKIDNLESDTQPNHLHYEYIIKEFGSAVAHYCYQHYLNQDLSDNSNSPTNIARKHLLKRRINKQQREHTTPLEESKALIAKVFEQLSSLLSSRQGFCNGDNFSLTDLCITAICAPLVMPRVYQEDILNRPEPEPDEFLKQLRATTAGQWIKATYDKFRPKPMPVHFKLMNHHPASTSPLNTFAYTKFKLTNKITGTATLKAAFHILRKWKPVFVISKYAVISKDPDVREALTRDTDFTIKEVNAPNMQRLNGPFFLGMDRSERYQQEHSDTRKAVHQSDMEWIANICQKLSDDLIKAAKPHQSIDVVAQYARPFARRFIAEYFGVSGPNEVTMMRWLRALFHDLFLNLSNQKSTQITAEQAYAEMRVYLMDLITQRKKELGENPSAPQEREDFLTRLIKLQLREEITLDDDGIRRNISGLIVGALDTTSKVCTLTLQQLLKHPEALEQARKTEDPDVLRGICFDALRFDTMAPIIRRYCKEATSIAGVTIPKDTSVFIATSSAMLDKDAWPDPHTIKADRDINQYMHFGFAMHQCFGEYVNRVQIPILIKGLIQLNELEQQGPLLYDGPFPDQWVLSFK